MNLSQTRLDANRANATQSTGPRTPEGKAKVSLNAVKTGLTGCTVLLPSDDAELYRAHIAAYEEELKPVGPEESSLVQSIADTWWRLSRIPALEMSIYARGRIDFADMFSERPEAERACFIELETYLFFESQFRNLHLQESRLNRRREKEMAELRALQQDRKSKELMNAQDALRARPTPPAAPTPTAAPQNGFEFSNPPAAAPKPAAIPVPPLKTAA